jgi:hypothetical protein
MSEATPTSSVTATCVGVAVATNGRVVSAVVLDDGEGNYTFIWNHDDMAERRQVLREFDGAATAVALEPDGTVTVVDVDGMIRSGGPGGGWRQQQASRRALICVRPVGEALFAGGELGIFQRGSGGWSPVAHPTGEEIDDLDGTVPERIYAVGLGRAVRLQGGRWIDLGLPANADLISILVQSDDDVLIGGKDGMMFRGAGGVWRQLSINALSVYAIAAYRGDIHLACADDGVWKLGPDGVEPVREDIAAFSMAAAGDYLAVGGREFMWRFDGSVWEHRRYYHIP